ncbi:M16 family metallopeptidase [Sphingosinicella sp. YJ22]|uniref:M16 family metallopeptidase n=1 Tax=Sphingosinicella sp. YJ22 TaxID=1104780 RepID=UPI00140D8573|nr:M16 family metallopeptidase [Sphingosinicella sp. YJ22]
MSLRTAALALLLILPAAAATAQQAPAPAPAAPGWLYQGSDIPPDPAWRFGTLANGLRYAVRRNARPERQVSIRLRIDAGALHEREEEQGWAHLVEHLAFRGTANFADREARQIWQQLGASFGSDTNAFTGPTQTFYQLDLPNADRTGLDRSLHVIADMMSSALFAPAAVDAERQIVIAEKERRPELSVRLGEAARGLFHHGLTFATRETIGTDETLRGATAEGLRAFYRRWYRPERATLVMVGDADPDMMVALIEQRFGGWRGQGEGPAEPDFGTHATPPSRTASLVYAGAPSNATIAWSRPYDPQRPTRERERDQMAESLAATILNRRLERHARGESAFINAGVGVNRHRGTAEITQLAITARNGHWREAMQQAFAIVADALRAPPSAAEIERELTNIRTAAAAAVQGEPTVASQQWAARMIGAVDDRGVITSARTAQALFEEFAPLMTPERIAAATRRLFAGAEPRLLLLSPEPIEGGDEALATALAAAERVQPATRGDERSVGFDSLPALPAPGREVSRERIEDLDVTIVRFANGSTLTFKPTRFEEGRVHVRLRFGGGRAGIDPARPVMTWAGGLVGPSGLADLDLDGLERLTTGRRIGLSFAVDEDAYMLAGTTSAEDLPDQLRLLTTKLTHPRWDAELFRRFQTNAVQSYDLQFATASARAGREIPSLLYSGDSRWGAVEREALASATVEDMRAYFAPRLAEGPVHVVIVGDVTLDAAVEAVRRSVAALPPRTTPAPAVDPARVEPPQPNPEPRRFTHNGDPSQAFALIGWSTLGGPDNLRSRRALALAANMFRVRLFDRLREDEGATYSPSATHASSDIFPNWGVFYAAAEVRSERIPAFFRAAREIIADLAARPVAADEFERAQNPVISGIERNLASNGYWLGAIESIAHDPDELAAVRSFLADYRALTPEDVRRAVADHVVEQGDWSLTVLPARQ